ncbi:putative nucleotidyltransferase [Leptolyngbya sp. PCC 7375]|nr:putative nucleotidyltransferase [Leptolyngbya sp. PCC 7375]
MVAPDYQHTGLTPGFKLDDLPTIEEVDFLNPKIKQLLGEFKQLLKKLYGQRLANLVLFGSFARHEETQDSDVDVLIVLKGIDVATGDEIWRLGDAEIELLLKYGELISVFPISIYDFLYRDSPLLRNIRQDGIVI